jgi:hypothetical protein
MFGQRVLPIAGHSAYGDPTVATEFHIDVVETGGAGSDRFQVFQLFEYIFGKPRIDEDRDDFRVGISFCAFLRQLLLGIFNLVIRFQLPESFAFPRFNFKKKVIFTSLPPAIQP